MPLASIVVCGWGTMSPCWLTGKIGRKAYSQGFADQGDRLYRLGKRNSQYHGVTSGTNKYPMIDTIDNKPKPPTITSSTAATKYTQFLTFIKHF